MKTLVFDSGPVINFALNSILWLFESLKEHYNGRFVVTEKVKRELIENPLRTKKFKFEALHILRYFDKKIFEVYKKEHFETQKKLSKLFNSIYSVKENNLEIVHAAEVGAVATAIHLNADALVIDERTTRLMLENPKLLARILERKLHSKVKINQSNLRKLLSLTKNVRMIRSIELVVYAYERGLLDKYLTSSIRQPKRTLLEAIIWGIKLNGCSISMKEMDEIKRIEAKRKAK